MIVESANPAHSLADSQRMREALDALELVVVIDVAMTETARHAALRAAGGVAVREVGGDVLQPRVPRQRLPAPRADLRAAAGHARRAGDPSPAGARARRAARTTTSPPLRRRALAASREAFADAFFQAMAERPHLAALAPVVLYETLGPTLPTAPRPAAVALGGRAHRARMAYPDSVRRAGFDGDGPALGEQLFEAILTRRSGVIFTVDDYAETWKRLDTDDSAVNLAIPELLDELARPARRAIRRRAIRRSRSCSSAGERRTSTANTIFRDPAWRKKDAARRAAHEPRRRRRGSASPTAVACGSPPSGQRGRHRRDQRHACSRVTSSLPNGLGLVLPGRRRGSPSSTASRRTS